MVNIITFNFTFDRNYKLSQNYLYKHQTTYLRKDILFLEIYYSFLACHFLNNQNWHIRARHWQIIHLINTKISIIHKFSAINVNYMNNSKVFDNVLIIHIKNNIDNSFLFLINTCTLCFWCAFLNRVIFLTYILNVLLSIYKQYTSIH